MEAARGGTVCLRLPSERAVPDGAPDKKEEEEYDRSPGAPERWSVQSPEEAAGK